MPPSHWVKLRQNSRLFEQFSITGSIVEPVVVNPDIDSNSASNRGISLSAYGSDPNSATENQPIATIAKLSLIGRSSISCVFSPETIPNINVMTAETRKGL